MASLLRSTAIAAAIFSVALANSAQCAQLTVFGTWTVTPLFQQNGPPYRFDGTETGTWSYSFEYSGAGPTFTIDASNSLLLATNSHSTPPEAIAPLRCPKLLLTVRHSGTSTLPVRPAAPVLWGKILRFCRIRRCETVPLRNCGRLPRVHSRLTVLWSQLTTWGRSKLTSSISQVSAHLFLSQTQLA